MGVLPDTLVTPGERSRWFGLDQRYSDQVTLNAGNVEVDVLMTDLWNRRVVEKLLGDPQRGPGAEVLPVQPA